MHPMLISVLNLLSAAAAFVAAYFWHRSTTILAPYEPEKHKNEPSYGSMVLDKNGKLFDGATTAFIQAQANRRGALAAGTAAAIQGVSLLVQAIAA